MKYDDLRKKLFRNLVIGGAMVGLILPVLVYLYLMRNSLQSDYNKAKSDIVSLEEDYKKTSANLEKAGLVFGSYSALPTTRLPLPTSDTMDVTSRIREARLPLQELKERYQLTRLDMSLTAPVEITGEMKKNKISAATSKVTLKFAALTDELALSFIDALIAEFPGYVRIDSLLMKRSGGQIDDKLLSDIKAGILPPIVDGTLVFEWVKLKDESIKEKPPAAAPAAQPIIGKPAQ